MYKLGDLNKVLLMGNPCLRSKADLAKQLTDLKDELLKLRVQQVAGGSSAKLTKM
jgi:hypothetical protein